ncbi:MAG: hypothetical protein ACRDT2_11365 [Natronosporangium sp.]
MLPTQREVLRRCATCTAPLAAADGYCWSCGYAQPDAADGGGAGEPDRPREQAVLLPTRPGSLRGIAVTGAAIGLVLVLAAAILVVRAVFFAPDDLVRAYFAALADRDADRAWSMLAGDTAGPRQPLLAAAAIESPGYRPPANVTIASLTRDEGDTVADVSFDVEGVRQQVSVGLDSGRRGLLRRWEIDNGIFAVQLAGGGVGAEPSLAGVRAVPDQTGAIRGFPGGYVVTLPDHPLLELPPAVVVAGGAPVTVSPVVRDAAAAEIERQVHAYLDECLASGQLRPEGCQFSAGAFGSFTTYVDVSWSLIEYPTLGYEVTPDGSVHVSGRGGSAVVTGTADSLFAEDLDEVVELVVEGSVVADGDQVRFQPDGS